VLFERTEDQEETPLAKAWMSEATEWPKTRMLSQKSARRFYRVKVPIRHLPTGIDRIPLELPLHVGYKNVRLEDDHDVGEGERVRTRCRMASKSA